MLQIVVKDEGTIKLVQSILTDMPKALRRLIRNANVDAIRAVRGEIPKSVSARYALSRSGVRSHMQLSVRSEDGGFRMGLVVHGKRIPMIDFEGVKPKTPPVQAGIPVANRPPITITTVRNQSRTGRPNRFIAQMKKSGHTGVFRRKSRLHRSDSLPIAESFSESIPEMVRVKEVRAAIEMRARETLHRSLERNLKNVLKPKP